ncbi:MAG: hypothetical protein DDT32_00958 [Syntrophomonadaceae bacterium]|nr:hypothetical protein [Bacillota bacterium]MBT9147206.1 hypothetical protein [Bacillota bacterium]
MSKVVCIPDTSALQNLRGIIVGGRDIRDWLMDELEVLLTEKILLELEDGRAALEAPDTLFNRLKGLAKRVQLENDLREALNDLADQRLSKFQDGELTSVVLGLRLVQEDRVTVRHVIFLSDDLDAFESEQGRRLLNPMPAFCFWTSADFVLYLAFRLGARGGVGMRREDFLNALEMAIQHMCEPILTMPSSSVRQKTLDDWRKRRSEYVAWLRRAYEGSGVNWQGG